MHTTTESRPTALWPSDSPSHNNRYDIYGTIHKALRLCMMEALASVGTMDLENTEELRVKLASVEAMLGLMRTHLTKENKFLHPALDARQPGASQRIAAEHVEHEQAIDALFDDVADLCASNSAQRGALGQRLYHHLALAIADNLEHMHYEETVHNAVLWSAYTDAELQALEGQIKASLAPQEMMLWLRWITRSATPQQVINMMADMRANAPKEVFGSAVQLVREQLSASRWTMVSMALDLPQVDGLVDLRSH
jgi:hypothetical protein